MDSSESLEALEVEEKRLADEQNDKLEDDDDVDEEEEEEEEDEEEGATVVEESQHSELQRLGDESKRLETLEVVAPSSAALSKDDQSVGLRVTSASETHVEVKSQAQNGVSHSHQEVSGSATVQREAQNQSDAQSSGCPPSLSELSPTSVTQPISYAPSPTQPERRLSPLKVDNKFLSEADLQDSTDKKALTFLTSPTPGARSPIPDGYNWRKYGQKQVKSPKGSRSYYKCTYSDCFAKKIECSDHSGQVIEIVNKGMHTHDPPRKNHSTRESRVALTPRAVLGNTVTEQPKTAKDSDPPTSSKETMQVSTISDRKRQNSSGSNDSGDIQVKDEQHAEPEPKRRLKKSSTASPGAIVKPGKKPKFVVHAAGDVGISGDGYRWRKYGQKMVKGNPHPRNYYRCTSAGCPVRKHIETAVDNTNAVIITYKGVHDHDMPVPKKRHGPPSAPLIAAAAPASMNNSQLKKIDTSQNPVTSTQWSVSKEGELTGETVDVGGEKEKAIESARTLLSIGFEIKPC